MSQITLFYYFYNNAFEERSKRYFVSILSFVDIYIFIFVISSNSRRYKARNRNTRIPFYRLNFPLIKSIKLTNSVERS